jgi:hypothetical protein
MSNYGWPFKRKPPRAEHQRCEICKQWYDNPRRDIAWNHDRAGLRQTCHGCIRDAQTRVTP